MRILGFPVPFTGERQKALNSVSETGRGGWQRIYESFTGAWQRNVVINFDAAKSFHADFVCKTLIASDIAKLRVKYVEKDTNGIWVERVNSAYDPVLRKPNHYQTRIQFWECWILSKLSRGNTYVLKQRDSRGVVNALYVLNPAKVTPLIADDGSVFYRLSQDALGNVESDIIVPAREIIHDRFNCVDNHLVGVPPIFASGRASQQGVNIQNNSIRLFENNSSPGGILTAPGQISEPTAKRLKDDWEQNFSGRNVGRVAVLGDGLKFEKLSLTAVEGQLIEQLRLTAEIVCATYHVPKYKAGIGELPPFGNIQSANIEYFSECLQVLIESAEELMDEGLEIKTGAGTEFDTDNLLRMDSITQMSVLKEGVGASIMAPDEARRKIDLPPVPGGASPMAQQQNFSLAALAKRDAQADPFATNAPGAPAAAPANDNATDEEIANAKVIAGWKLKSLLAPAA